MYSKMQREPERGSTAWRYRAPSLSMTTSSPGASSRSNSAPMMSSAHVSDASTVASSSRPTTRGRIPEPDLAAEARLHRFLADAAEQRLLRSAHDVADGGLAVTIAESAIAGGLGVDADCPDPFGEGDGRVVISARADDVAALEQLAGELPLRRIGHVGGTEIVLSGQAVSLAEAAEIWEGALGAAVEGGG